MCSVSAVSDYYMRQWPINNPQTPNVMKVVDDETKQMIRDVMKRLDQIDKRLGDVECLDAQKAKWLEELNNG